MVSIVSLWIPILGSAVAVFILSSIVHMVLKYHNSDYQELPSEDQVRAALGGLNIPPNDYMIPHGKDMSAMKDPEFIEKMNQGPVAMMTVWKNGPPTMGASLMQWFGFSILVSVFAAYLSGRALGPGAEFMEVFRFAGAAAFGGYALATIPDSIWYKRQWSTTAKNVFDGLVYGLATGVVFAWLWPAA